MSQSGFHILLIGKKRNEFSPVFHSLQAEGRVTGYSSPSQCLDEFSDRESSPVWDLIVLLQSLPDEFRREDLASLRNTYPLTPMVFVQGAWCEGTLRTGEIFLPGTTIYAHQWEACAPREMAALRRNVRSSWSLPLSAGGEEAVLFELPCRMPGETVVPPKTPLCEAIILEDFPFGTDLWMNDLLFELLEKKHFRVKIGTTDDLNSRQSLVVADLSEAEHIPTSVDKLLAECSRLGVPCLLFLVHSPRHTEWVSRTSANPGLTLLSKPFGFNDLSESVNSIKPAPFESNFS